jgi:hypothetical protein
MNARNWQLGFVVLALTSCAGIALSIGGCGGGGANPTPDASHPLDGSKPDSPATDSPSSDHASPDGGNPDGKPPTDSGPDVNIPDVSLDTGSCSSDSAACNSCYTDAQAKADPLNACSSLYTKNCLQFTGTVPTHGSL